MDELLWIILIGGVGINFDTEVDNDDDNDGVIDGVNKYNCESLLATINPPILWWGK